MGYLYTYGCLFHTLRGIMKKFTLLLMLCAPVTLADQIAASSNKGVKPPVAAAAVTPDLLKVTDSDALKNEQIPKSATFGTHTLTRAGTGIRKKMLFVDVYRATLLVADSAKFSRKTEGNAALDSLSTMAAVALVLDFKRGVSAKDVANSFDTAFKANNIKDSPALIQFKKSVEEAGDVAKGQRLSLAAVKGTLTCELGKKIVEIKGDAQFIRDVFSIWLGTPVDGGLKSLREALISGK